MTNDEGLFVSADEIFDILISNSSSKVNILENISIFLKIINEIFLLCIYL